jgi:hypothetical protein
MASLFLRKFPVTTSGNTTQFLVITPVSSKIVSNMVNNS